MYTSRSHQVDDRIVSIHQPHVRPIIRGKAKAKVEFGAKLAKSLVNGYALYRNRKNMAFCKANGIRLSGPQFGDPQRTTT
jgi:hypothetical protein